MSSTSPTPHVTCSMVYRLTIVSIFDLNKIILSGWRVGYKFVSETSTTTTDIQMIQLKFEENAGERRERWKTVGVLNRLDIWLLLLFCHSIAHMSSFICHKMRHSHFFPVSSVTPTTPWFKGVLYYKFSRWDFEQNYL